ncbi:MAG: exosome complex protein Rrp42 [Nanoarchaeota archaeon]|nr:exosome complex protein Rrp42 [Nanoarchaeota archaeon]MBU4241838.1 exosome complex protein Rrp42 [Nanoarchaeota archaeon]MBU4352409.1 exosome complex protein Rrp42 [Nanoarchaeota archaeon]MBU4456064.1 exosome complex protein Rrp42 [Nanoarchaeota archaeon]MCG2720297.1 exosome complex protein Rrp42 [Nanoarchaeota archaeon]
MLSISKNYIQALAKKGLRADQRKMEEFRKPITVEYGISSKSAEGSARVKIGDTEVIAGVKTEVGKPYPDSLGDGTIMVNVELLPLSSPEYESGPPSIDAIELARVVDRGIRESHAIDFKKLCVKEGELVWTVMIDIYPINATGNLFDACALAALAALKDAKFPKLEGDVINYKEKTDTPIPLEFLPVSCTIHKIGGKFLVDPTRDEELASDARLTIAFTESGKICAMQKGGDSPFTEEEVLKIVDLAAKKTVELRQNL